MIPSLFRRISRQLLSTFGYTLARRTSDGMLPQRMLSQFLHLFSAKAIGEWIWDRMVVGGILIYDDYRFKGCAGGTAWVEEQRARSDRLLIHNLNGHAVVVKLR